MAAGEPHEPFKIATWRHPMVPRGPAVVLETENEMGATTKIEAGDITTHNQSGRKQNHGGTMEGMGSKGSKSTRNKWAAAEGRWNEWEQKKNKITLNTWDFRHAAATTQTASTAASSTTYVIVVAEAGDTTGAKISMSAGPAGVAKGMSGHNTRVTPDNATETTVTRVHEISQNKLDFQMPEQERQ